LQHDKIWGDNPPAPNSGGICPTFPAPVIYAHAHGDVHHANKSSRWAEYKTLNGPRVHGISPVVKKKVYRGKDLPKSQVLSSEWKTEQVREDASGDSEDGDSEDGEDDELPCVIGESEGDCGWRGSRRSVGSSFHRQGAAYRKERLLTFKEDEQSDTHITVIDRPKK